MAASTTSRDVGTGGGGIRAWSGEIFILLAAVVLLFVGLGDLGLQHSEVRWAEITREMFLSGDFFHPTICGEPYFDKPLLTYWLVAAVAAIFHRMDEWATRVPSALSGVIAVLATMWIGRKLWSARVGVIAGTLLLTMYGFLLWGRDAQADMENLAAITVAVAWYWHRRDKPNFATFLGFYLIAFMGALTKGLPAVVVPMLAVLPDVATQKRWRRLLTPSHALAALIGLLVYLAPFWYAQLTVPTGYGESGLMLVYRENILRFFQPFDHKGPIYLYFFTLPYLMLPWAPIFLAAIAVLFKIRKVLNHQTRWLAWCAMTIFAFFTMSGSRRGYYILPLLPFCALLTSAAFLHARAGSTEPIRRWGLRIQAVLLGAVVALEFAAVPIARLLGDRLGPGFSRATLHSMPPVAAAATLAGLAGFYIARRNEDRSMRAFMPMAGVALALMGGVFCYQLNTNAAYGAERAFASRLAGLTRGIAPEEIGVFMDKGPTLFFYLKTPRPLRMIRTPNRLRKLLAADRLRVVVTRRRFADDARRAASGRLDAPPVIAQEPAPGSGQPADSDWIAWLLPGNTPDRASAERARSARTGRAGAQSERSGGMAGAPRGI